MASRFKAIIGLHRLFSLQKAFKCVTVQCATVFPLRRFNSVTPNENEPKASVNPENESLLENLNLLGVDVKMARKRQPGVFRRVFTNEQCLAKFLQGKGASRQTVASIISRYPRAITRSLEYLEQRWQLWRNIFQTDEEIVSILDRSPESFFRSSDNSKLEKNIAYLSSLKLSNKDLHRLLATAPRTFSNSLELNRQMVEFLEDVCVELGGTGPEEFAKAIISRNLYVLIRSTKRIKANIDNLRAALKLSDAELLVLLQGSGAKILDLSNEYLKNNMASLQERLLVLGCSEEDVKKLIVGYPMVLYIGATTLSIKLDCLLKGGITMKQILKKPKVLDYSTQNVTARLEELHEIGYNFEVNGIGILDLSQKRFAAKIEKLVISPD
ncbi:transcription termination factor 1, mitochondrial [Phyllopteryx taeniolatus]|uniref:transcription termination factor 1, mitochondrial n=1 Tax=Phyllopteryx taeniolatus TaxID=161469 RepID=UPI002AD3BDDA|nr:transcription termination factor 1, mitochondrial [Phyllopteryx taeniolatus]XP_061616966.1 transcription termination factor 1, mitochondrial [Phyllopteryx taeniolatus]